MAPLRCPDNRSNELRIKRAAPLRALLHSFSSSVPPVVSFATNILANCTFIANITNRPLLSLWFLSSMFVQQPSYWRPGTHVFGLSLLVRIIRLYTCVIFKCTLLLENIETPIQSRLEWTIRWELIKCIKRNYWAECGSGLFDYSTLFLLPRCSVLQWSHWHRSEQNYIWITSLAEIAYYMKNIIQCIFIT